MLKTTATKARGAQKESRREGEAEKIGGRGDSSVWGGGATGMEGAADPLHPAEAVFISQTLSYYLSFSTLIDTLTHKF